MQIKITWLFHLMLLTTPKVLAGETKKEIQTDIKSVVARVQKVYDNTSDYFAQFEQSFHHKIFKKKEISTGAVQFKKPGLMRFDYQSPKKKSFIVDGKNLWIVQYDDHLALVDKCFKQDGLTASIAFLWGQGKISEQFDVVPFKGLFGEKSDLHLELNPKQKTSLYRKLILVVDPKTYHVKQSIVVDLQGNVNQFKYASVKMNQKLEADIFKFKKPKGMHESPLPGSCTSK